jgi:hypothetical protein
MVSIAFGSNPNAIGQRFWLAGAPGVDATIWTPEDSYPPLPKRQQQQEMGAGWPTMKYFDMGNAATVWNFSTLVQLRSSAETLRVLHSLDASMIWEGILEHWVPNDGTSYFVYRSAEPCSLQVAGSKSGGQALLLQFTASYGRMNDCGIETPTIQRLTDGNGNLLTDGNGNYLSVGYGWRPWF